MCVPLCMHIFIVILFGSPLIVTAGPPDPQNPINVYLHVRFCGRVWLGAGVCFSSFFTLVGVHDTRVCVCLISAAQRCDLHDQPSSTLFPGIMPSRI